MGSARSKLSIVAATLAVALMSCSGDAAVTTSTVASSSTIAPSIEPCETVGTCEPSPELIAAAQAEGQLVSLGQHDLGQQELHAQAFEEKYGIPVNFSQTSQLAELVERVSLEHETGQVTIDVMGASNDAAFVDLSDQGVLGELNVEDWPNLAAAESLSMRGTFADWGGFAYGLGWNTNLVDPADVPESWCELTDPRWRNQVLTLEQPVAVAHIVLSVAEELCGPGFIEAFAENEPIYITASNQAVLDALAAGEGSLAIILFHSAVSARNDGLPIDVKVVDGMVIGSRYIAALDGAPHPNAARLYINFLLSEEAQTIAWTDQQGVSVLGDQIEGTIPIPEHVVYVNASEVHTQEYHDEIRSRLGLS